MSIDRIAELLAKTFHETYERLAPEYGYKTRQASAKPWADVPEQNKALMIATCREILGMWRKFPILTRGPMREKFRQLLDEFSEKFMEQTAGDPNAEQLVLAKISELLKQFWADNGKPKEV